MAAGEQQRGHRCSGNAVWLPLGLFKPLSARGTGGLRTGRAWVRETWARKAACFPKKCFQGALEVQPAGKSSLETAAEGCRSQH